MLALPPRDGCLLGSKLSKIAEPLKIFIVIIFMNRFAFRYR